MATLKLKNAGEEMTLVIKAVEIITGTDPKMGNQVKFTNENGDDLYVGEAAVLRQLDRCGVGEIGELAGRGIHFSRAANTKNPGFPPYWNLSKATAEDLEKPKPSGNGKLLPNETGSEDYHQETGGPPQGSVTAFDALVLRYGECLDAVSELLANRNMKVDSQAYSAMVATCFISRNQKGV